MGRRRVLQVSARCGRAVGAFLLRGLIETGKSMGPYGPALNPELYDEDPPDYHPDRWTARLSLRERRLWRGIEHGFRAPDARSRRRLRAVPSPAPVPARAPRRSARQRPGLEQPAPPGPAEPGAGWQPASDQQRPPR